MWFGETSVYRRKRAEMSSEQAKLDMSITRIFDAPVEQVWKAWSESEAVKQWWGPTGFTAPVANMDFREGGTSLVCMRAPKEFGGQDMYNTWTYTTIIPMERIEFIHRFSDQNGNVIDHVAMGLPADIPRDVRHVLTFKALDGNRTEFAVTEYGYASEQTVELSRGGMAQCLDKLAASL
jgi:uncharacterized protein YndB with AHSA1/START domain